MRCFIIVFFFVIILSRILTAQENRDKYDEFLHKYQSSQAYDDINGAFKAALTSQFSHEDKVKILIRILAITVSSMDPNWDPNDVSNSFVINVAPPKGSRFPSGTAIEDIEPIYREAYKKSIEINKEKAIYVTKQIRLRGLVKTISKFIIKTNKKINPDSVAADVFTLVQQSDLDPEMKKMLVHKLGQIVKK
jgi:hypothetical protein